MTQNFKDKPMKNSTFPENCYIADRTGKIEMNKIVKVDGIRSLEAQLAEPYNAERPKLTSRELFKELKRKDLLVPHLACFYVTYERSKSDAITEVLFAEDKKQASILASNKFANVKRVKSLGEIT